VCLDIKELLKDAHGVLGTGNRMANGSGISVNLVIVAALESLVTKEVNVLVGNAIGLLGLVLEVLEAVGLVPASREHVEGNLSANGKGEAEMTKSLLEDSDKLLTDLGILVVLLEVVSFLCASVTADGADVNHAVAELDKGSALDGNVEISDVVEDKVGELLVLLFTNEFDEGVWVEWLAELVGSEAVLGEAKVEESGDGLASGLAQLLLLLGEVGTADETDGALWTKLLEDGKNLGGSILGSCQRFVENQGSIELWRTRRAGVRVPSTSKRQMVSLRGRSGRGEYDGGARDIVKVVV
jgi:hypothetical protein